MARDQVQMVSHNHVSARYDPPTVPCLQIVMVCVKGARSSSSLEYHHEDGPLGNTPIETYIMGMSESRQESGYCALHPISVSCEASITSCLPPAVHLLFLGYMLTIDLM